VFIVGLLLIYSEQSSAAGQQICAAIDGALLMEICVVSDRGVRQYRRLRAVLKPNRAFAAVSVGKET
jgi:hypothetical protein